MMMLARVMREKNFICCVCRMEFHHVEVGRGGGGRARGREVLLLDDDA